MSNTLTADRKQSRYERRRKDPRWEEALVEAYGSMDAVPNILQLTVALNDSACITHMVRPYLLIDAGGGGVGKSGLQDALGNLRRRLPGQFRGEVLKLARALVNEAQAKIKEPGHFVLSVDLAADASQRILFVYPESMKESVI